MLRRRAKEEDGGSLAIVLVFITVFGLIIGGLLTEAGASLRFSTVVSDHQKKVYAADAGISTAIQQLHQDNSFCASGTDAPITNLQVGGRTISVSCTTTSGAANGAMGYAIITTSTAADSLKLSSGHTKHVSGPVFVNGGVSWGPGIEVEDGDFRQKSHSGSCVGTPPVQGAGKDLNVLPSPPYGYYCVNDDIPAVSHNPPFATPPAAAPSPSPISGGCQVWYPGTYTSPPTLTAATNYFASGVYYFNFSGELKIDHATLIGGQASSYEKGKQKLGGESFTNGVTSSGSTTFTSATASFTAADVGRRITGTNIQASTTIASVASTTSVNLSLPATATGSGTSFTIVRPPTCAQVDPTGVTGYTPTGTGVEFVFGGGASMNVFTQGEVELFGRTGETGSATNNISFIAVPSDGTWSGWNPATAGTTVLQVKDGDAQKLAIHGLIYAYDQNVQLTATNDSVAQVLGGVLASKLDMQSSASAEGLAVSVLGGTPEPRNILLVACTDPGPASDGTCKNPGSGERPVQSSAVVEVGTESSRPVTVLSWRTRGHGDSS